MPPGEICSFECLVLSQRGRADRGVRDAATGALGAQLTARGEGAVAEALAPLLEGARC